MRHYLSLKDRFAFTIAVIHSVTRYNVILTSKGHITSSLILLFISFLVISIFGFCFIVYGQGSRLANKLLRNIAKGIILLLFVAVTGAVSNTIQNSTLDVFGGPIVSMLIGGAIGGIVAFVGMLVNQEVEKLPALHLTIIGATCVATSFFGNSILTLAILVGQNWP